jgi:3,2-trans-enoyl-CoA isomerase
MDFIDVSRQDGTAILTLRRGKVNALNEALVNELHGIFQGLETDDSVSSVILTGHGKFFTFGFDIPEFLGYTKDAFIRYLRAFTGLYTYIWMFPKPVVMAINGHAIAGGCMMAMAGDYRVMVSGKARISLNEITFGSSVFCGCVEMLKFWVGGQRAQRIVYSGDMYTADQALDLGLIDHMSSAEGLAGHAIDVARTLAANDPATFLSIKRLLRKPVHERMISGETDAVLEFADIWYSASTWENLQAITIRE